MSNSSASDDDGTVLRGPHPAVGLPSPDGSPSALDRRSHPEDPFARACECLVRLRDIVPLPGTKEVLMSWNRILTRAELEALTRRTLGHYDAVAEAFDDGTRDHDVSQNYAAFLGAIEGPAPFTLLDFGCGPGRDVAYFKSLGHEAVGLDGAARFVAMAHTATGCEILHQSFLALNLPRERFHGVFANASLFHVPSQELGRVLAAIEEALLPRGVLFASNPHGDDHEGFSGDRYGAFLTLATWRGHVTAAGFDEIEHYYRPPGKPRSQQPWLATVWRKR
jgi:SAM-dependent methyltransferase